MAVLETWMKSAGLDDEALSQKLGISRVHANRLRNRRCLPSTALAKQLADLTEIPVEQFLLEDRAA